MLVVYIAVKCLYRKAFVAHMYVPACYAAAVTIIVLSSYYCCLRFLFFFSLIKLLSTTDNTNANHIRFTAAVEYYACSTVTLNFNLLTATIISGVRRNTTGPTNLPNIVDELYLLYLTIPRIVANLHLTLDANRV